MRRPARTKRRKCIAADQDMQYARLKPKRIPYRVTSVLLVDRSNGINPQLAGLSTVSDASRLARQVLYDLLGVVLLLVDTTHCLELSLWQIRTTIRTLWLHDHISSGQVFERLKRMDRVCPVGRRRRHAVQAGMLCLMLADLWQVRAYPWDFSWAPKCVGFGGPG
jgi:hypothetical protein